MRLLFWTTLIQTVTVAFRSQVCRVLWQRSTGVDGPRQHEIEVFGNKGSGIDGSRQHEIEVFSTKGCRFCRQSKAKLVDLGLPGFRNIDLDDVQQSDHLDTRTNGRLRLALSTTVPQIYVSDEHIGGYDDLSKEISSGEFFNRLKRASVERIESSNNGLQENEQDDEGPFEYDDGDALVALSQGSNGLPILNGGIRDRVISHSDIRSAIQLSRDLQSAALGLLDEFSTLDGSRVNYKQMRNSLQFHHFVRLSCCFRDVPLGDLAALTSDQRFSMFTNIYNALIIHGTCVVGAPEDTPEARSVFFSGAEGVAYEISGLRFTADDIEHGILRANCRHPYATPAEQATFLPDGDPRGALSVSDLDPRVHFVLNCGAKSCPPIKILSDDPEPALQAGARAYLADNVSIIGKYETDADMEVQIVLPKLLYWYRADFGQTDYEVLLCVAGMLEAGSSLRRALETIVRTERRVTVAYDDYDWGSNQTE